MLGERIRTAVSAEAIADEVAVTVRVGVATGTDDIEAVVRDADTALYEAKAAGRNRVVRSRRA